MNRTESIKLTKNLLLIQHTFTQYTPVGQYFKANKVTEKGSKNPIKTKMVADTVARERENIDVTLSKVLRHYVWFC